MPHRRQLRKHLTTSEEMWSELDVTSQQTADRFSRREARGGLVRRGRTHSEESRPYLLLRRLRCRTPKGFATRDRIPIFSPPNSDPKLVIVSEAKDLAPRLPLPTEVGP
jgi:hypothetical protein